MLDLLFPVTEETGLLAPSQFIGDVTPPELTSFSFALHPGTIDLTFSETVDLTTFDVTSIALQAESSINESRSGYDSEADGMPLQLTGGTISPTSESTTVSITLTPSDLNSIKHDGTLAISENSTYLAIDSTLVNDMTGNPIVTIQSENAKKVSSFTGDTASPEFVHF